MVVTEETCWESAPALLTGTPELHRLCRGGVRINPMQQQSGGVRLQLKC